jgi:hypothetical protein
VSLFNFNAPPQQAPETPRQKMVRRLSEGVPPELVARAAGVAVESFQSDPELQMAIAEGEIKLFENARDSGVTGIVRAAMRYESKTWQPKAEPNSGMSLEDYLKED